MNQEVVLLVDGLILIQILEKTVAQEGLNFDSICARAGISRRNLGRYAKGSRWPSTSTIRKLNEAYAEELKVMAG